MSNEKLITLSQFKSGLQSTKGYMDAADAALSGRIDAVVADIEEIVSVGGEANILEGMKVNGVALPITDKLVNLIIESGSENGTINVAGIDVAVKGLTKLAYANEITNDDLSDALKASIAAAATNADLSKLEVRVTTAEGEITTIKGRADALEAAVEALENAGYQTAAQVETIARAAVAASGHAKFEEAESDPTADGFVAEKDVMYLWPAEDGDGYSIYAKVGDGVKLLGHTKVKLTDYSSTEQMNAAIAAAVADKAAMADLNAAVERITAVEAKFAQYYTIEQAEEKFTDESEAQAIAETAASGAESAAKSYADEKSTAAETAAKSYADEKASAAETAANTYTDEQIAAAQATDEEFNAAMGEVFHAE